MKSPFLYVLLLGAFFLSSCMTTYRISSDIEENVNFSSYKTFRVLNHKNGFPVGASPITKQRIDRAMKSEMLGLGFTENLHADLIVAWMVKVKDVRVVDVYHNHYHEWNMMGVADNYQYKEGTLIVDLIDAKSRQVIWHGRTSDRVYEGMPKVDEKINAAVRAMFEKYEKDVAAMNNYAVF